MSAVENPPAFPQRQFDSFGHGEDQAGPEGMTLRDWFAGMMPSPDERAIATQQSFDKGRNPYNDSHRPPLRSREQIIAYLRYRQADAMLAARQEQAA